MLDMLQVVLSPIVHAMRLLLEVFYGVSGSMGLSIILVSFTFALVMLPLRRRAERVETRIRDRVRITSQEVKALGPDLKGEARFNATEKIYQQHGYHPIQSVGLGLSFIVMLPVLISAVLLLNGTDALAGHGFLAIDDLSEPDRLLFSINILPFAMSGMTVLDAKTRYKGDPSTRMKFYVIAGLLFLLVYDLASGLVLYWIASNLFSMLLERFRTIPRIPQR